MQQSNANGEGGENGGGGDSPRQTDLSGKDAGSFTKEHKGSFSRSPHSDMGAQKREIIVLR